MLSEQQQKDDRALWHEACRLPFPTNPNSTNRPDFSWTARYRHSDGPLLGSFTENQGKAYRETGAQEGHLLFTHRAAMGKLLDFSGFLSPHL